MLPINRHLWLTRLSLQGLRTGFVGFTSKDREATIYDGGEVPFSATNLKRVGESLVALLSSKELVEESANKYVYVTSFTTTQNKILSIYEKLTGMKWKVNELQAESVLSDGLEKFKSRDFSAVPRLIQAAIFSKETLADFSGKSWDKKLGLPEESLEETIKAASQ